MLRGKLIRQELLKSKAYIDGAWINAEDNTAFPVRNPADHSIITNVPSMGESETAQAIEAAAVAFDSWRTLTAKERGKLLRRWYELILANKNDLAAIMTAEQGKPLKEAAGEIVYAASFVEWFSEEAKRVYGDIIPSVKAGQRLLVMQQPVGVVAAITPWNFPAAMITRKVAPALAAGCTVVLKPAEQTPLTALALAALAEEAGFPKGVLNIITGASEEIGPLLTTHPLVRKISFTGSTEVGKILLKNAADSVKKVSMELGGNAPFIIFEDADIDAAIAGVMASKFRNNGQTCVSANRIFVHTKVFDTVAARLVKEIKKLKVGNGFDEGVVLGPLIDMHALEKVQHLLADAIGKGAKLLQGGKAHKLGGTFFEPTLLSQVTGKMAIAREEIFGPIAALQQFKSEEEAIAMANDTPFGLAAYFYSQDSARIWRMAEALDYGMIGINDTVISNEVAPFGGMKQSGMGREGSYQGIEEYLETKYLCWTAR